MDAMRPTLLVIVTGLLLGPLAGCGSEPPGNPPPGTIGPTVPSGEPSGTPGPTSSSSELPGGLPYGERTATGVVERSGGCTLLNVDGSRWELTGPMADQLEAGARVTVTGQVTTGGCAGVEVVRTLVVLRVSR